MRTEARQFTPRDDAGDRARGAGAAARPAAARAGGAGRPAAGHARHRARIAAHAAPAAARRHAGAWCWSCATTCWRANSTSMRCKAHPATPPALAEMQQRAARAGRRDRRAGRRAAAGPRSPTPCDDRRPRAGRACRLDAKTRRAARRRRGPTPALLARGLASRIGHINDEVLRLVALARGERRARPRGGARQLADVREPHRRGRCRPSSRCGAGTRRRCAMRSAPRSRWPAGYAIAVALPWGSHDYWILLTIVVVLRGSLSQTLERRNSRVAGTLLGCVLAVALLSAHPARAGAAGRRRPWRRPSRTASRCGATSSPRWPPRCSAWCRRTCSTPARARPSRCVERVADTLIGAAPGLGLLLRAALVGAQRRFPRWSRAR